MESIKERAIAKYCTHCGSRAEYNCSADETPCPYVKDYIKIATEQEKVDDAKIAGIIEFVHKNKEFMKPYGWFVEVSQLVEYVKSMYPDKEIAVLANGSFILRQKEE